MSRRAEQKQDREFRNRSGIPGEIGWGIRNPNAEFAGSLDVDLLIPVAGRLDELEFGLALKQRATDISHGEKHIEIECRCVLATNPLNYFMVCQCCTKPFQKLRCKEVRGMEKCNLHVHPFKFAYQMEIDG
jgi:hypothetical protein